MAHSLHLNLKMLQKIRQYLRCNIKTNLKEQCDQKCVPNRHAGTQAHRIVLSERKKTHKKTEFYKTWRHVKKREPEFRQGTPVPWLYLRNALVIYDEKNPAVWRISVPPARHIRAS
jgi:hypothetical protein